LLLLTGLAAVLGLAGGGGGMCELPERQRGNAASAGGASLQGERGAQRRSLEPAVRS
jgi:hypothetical protein